MQGTPHLPPLRPHSSTHFHLSAETALLGTLYTRSRAQHRAQPFLRHLQHVLRLSRGVLRALGPKQGGVGDGGSAAASGSSTPVPLADPRLGKLVQTLIPALLVASLASNRILTLHHFVPLHTLLLASYARLLAVSLGLVTALGLDTAALIAFPSDAGVLQKLRAAQPEIPTGARQMGHVGTADALGERIERAVELGERVERAPATVLASPKPKPAAVDRLAGKKRRKTSSLELDGGASSTPRGDTKLASAVIDVDVGAAPRPKQAKRDSDAAPSPTKAKHVDNGSPDASIARKDKGEKKRKAKEGKEGKRTPAGKGGSADASDEGRGDKPRSSQDLGADRSVDTPRAKAADKAKTTDQAKTAGVAKSTDKTKTTSEAKSTDRAKAMGKSKDKKKKKKKDAMDDIFGF